MVEFTPNDVNARGLSRDDFLAAGEAWETPDGNVDYVATAMWRLPKHTKKPEGVAAIDEDHILVAMDTKSMIDNGVIVRRPPR